MFDREIITGKVARDVMFQDCLFWVNAYDTGSMFIRFTAADDAERVVMFRNCAFIANKINSVAPANVVESSVTNAVVPFIDCWSVNVTSWASSTTNSNVYVPTYEAIAEADSCQGLMIAAA
jgi:hypothetical protein